MFYGQTSRVAFQLVETQSLHIVFVIITLKYFSFLHIGETPVSGSFSNCSSIIISTFKSLLTFVIYSKGLVNVGFKTNKLSKSKQHRKTMRWVLN